MGKFSNQTPNLYFRTETAVSAVVFWVVEEHLVIMVTRENRKTIIFKGFSPLKLLMVLSGRLSQDKFKSYLVYKTGTVSYQCARPGSSFLYPLAFCINSWMEGLSWLLPAFRGRKLLLRHSSRLISWYICHSFTQKQVTQ